MRALLDVNMLIALLDANHSHHERALGWFVEHAQHGWASCPLTQNGCLRIMSQPRYPGAQTLRDISERLAAFTRHPIHQFWPDAVSLLDSAHCALLNVSIYLDIWTRQSQSHVFRPWPRKLGWRFFVCW